MGDIENYRQKRTTDLRAEKEHWREIAEAIKAFERRDGAGNLVGGNGLTEGKFREPTLSRLVNSGRIGQDEIRAIEEIECVISVLCRGLFLHGYELREKLDRSTGSCPPLFLDAYPRYKRWANEWSDRKKRFGDMTLTVVHEILFSNRSGKDIDDEFNWRHGFALDIFVGGIRDYAASAGWIERNQSKKWHEVARSFFPLRRMRTRSA